MWASVTHHRAEAARRIKEAQDLGRAKLITGEPLLPRLSAAAPPSQGHQHHHIAVIRVFEQLPAGSTRRRVNPQEQDWPKTPRLGPRHSARSPTASLLIT
jgi:hypothetical protein